MKRKLLFLFSCFCILQGVYSQIAVQGTIISAEDKEPVIGASVLVKGTTVGTISDFDGHFTLNVPPAGNILIVSYVGMKTQEVQVKKDLTITLEPLSKEIDEIIVVAYGTSKKSSFTGSATNLGKDKIAKMQVSEVSKALEGAMAGVQISSSSGQPGSSATIRVRGVGSMLASSSPLIVLDGVPYEGALNSINPQDIESLSVLKDAAANSLYGARGANGVIMITTKKGAIGKVNISIENRTGVNFRGVNSYDVLDSPKEYYELYWESMRNQQIYGAGKSAREAGMYASKELIPTLGGYNSYSVPADLLVNPETGLLHPDANLLYQDNWFKEAFSQGLRQENNVTISGGTEATTYYVSLGYLYDDSYTEQSNMDRFSARVKLDQKITDWMKIGVNIAASTISSNSPAVGASAGSSIFYLGQMAAPIYTVYQRDDNGNYLYGSNGKKLYDYGMADGKKRPVGAGTNPIDQQANNIRENSKDIINAKFYAQVKFLKDFMFTANISVDNFNINSIDFQTPIGGDALNVNGKSTKTMSRAMSINANQLLNWNRTFGKHQVEALVGHESKVDNSTYLVGQKENFFLPNNPELDNAAKLADVSSGRDRYALEGYFSQVKYDFGDKYYLSASLRFDGSSRFHPNVRWGKFWSVGGAWRMNHENFLKDVSFVNDLKFKASFGTQGNDNLPDYIPYKDQYVVVSQDGKIGLQYVFRGNPMLTWEKSNNFNVGFDFRLFERFSGTIEYFYKQTWDLLYSKPLPPSQGSPLTIWENSMKMYNSGIELEMSYDIIARQNLRWNVSLNATHYKNALKELPADRDPSGWANGSKFLRKGASLYNWYGYKFAGVDPTNGDPLYYADVLNDKKEIVGVKTVNTTASATRYEFNKSSIPDLYGGFSTAVEYSGFDLNVSLAYQLGGWVDDTQYVGLMHGGNAGTNWHKDIYKRWTPSNTNTDVPRLHSGSLEINSSSDRFLVSSSYLSLRNASIGYTFPKGTLSKLKIEKIRLSLVGDNLALLSARRGFDPRQSFSGDSGYSYSAMRTFSFGLNINF